MILSDLDKFLQHHNIKSTRVLLSTSFEFYIRFMFFIVNESEIVIKPFHKLIIKTLEKYAYQKNSKRNLLINIPIGAGKTILCEYFISWCFARNINTTFLYSSYSDRLITKLSKETRDICMHPVWVKIFKNELKKDDQSKINWSFNNSKNRTGLTAGAMGSSLTGLDASNPNEQGFSGALIIDDPSAPDKVRYKQSREETILFYDEKLSTRRRTPQTPTILIQQRLHKNDLSGWVLDNEPDDWEIIKIPAIKDNISFWLERYPVNELNKIRNINAYKFACQYQQEPITLRGNVIQKQWFKYYQEIPEFNRVFLTADTAQKTKEHNDFTVFMAWGLTDSHLYVLDLMRDKWEAPQLLTNALSFWNKWKLYQNKHCTAFYIEDKVSGTGLIQQMQQQTQAPVIAVQKNKDKLTEVEDCLPYIESGKLLLPFNESYSYNKIIISECIQFTRDDSHDHDDVVDNICQAIKQTIGGSISILDAL